jgi:thioredoxin-dependent peroxiredoxin
MSGWLSIGASVGMAFLVAASVRAQTAAELKPGDPAPAFKLGGSDGRTYSLEEFRGKQAVVLAWFPKAFTGG